MRQIKIEQSITDRQDGSLQRYFAEISKYDMVTADQECELAQRIREGDEVALERLVNANLRFVVSVAKQYQNYGLSLTDLIEEGNVGLIEAARRFDETRGFKFISYAVWWIRQSIQKAIQTNSKPVRLPVNKQALLMKIKRVSALFFQEHQRQPDEEELTELLDCKQKQVHEALESQVGYTFLDSMVSEDSKQSRSEQFNVEDHSNVEDSVFELSMQQDVGRILAKLPKIEAQILTDYFGLNGHPKLSMNELSRRLGLSVERIRQLKNKAFKRIRSVRADHFQEYLNYH